MASIGHSPLSQALKNSKRAGPRKQTSRRSCFLVTVDTECDDAWTHHQQITTKNAEFLPRFQQLCESYGLTPTYFTTFEMANSSAFREFGQDILKRGKGEIGMHLHAWNSLPLVPLTSYDTLYHPYLTEYPEPVMRDKINFMTDLLEDTFGEKVVSHRAGRWGFNATYARLLVERGYLADCSVTPLISWAEHLGDPNQGGGPDYSGFPLLPYFLDLDDISRSGNSNLLEIPVTAMRTQPRILQKLTGRVQRHSLLKRTVDRAFPPVCWLAPTRGNIGALLRVTKKSLLAGRPCVQFALHSSNLMPGGSPFFPKERDVEALYDDLGKLFSLAGQNFRGATVKEFRREFAEA